MLLTTTTVGVCPLCGANHATCGQASTAQPVDILTTRESTVGTQKYRVTVNGHKTVMKLSEEDAKAYQDAQPIDAPAPAEEAPAKARSAPNKARGAQSNK